MNKSYDLVIIGGGPAGLTAGIYAKRYGINCVVIEKYFLGGQMNLTTEIKNYPGFEEISGAELSERMKNHYLSYNGEIMKANVVDVDFDNKKVKTSKEEIEYKSLIIASGCSARKLNLDKEEQLTGHGISYCAICDGFFFKNKDVIVVGSGNSALEDAIYLSGICKSVSIVSKHKEFRAQEIFKAQLRNKNNIKYYMGYMPSKIFGEDLFAGVEIENTETKEKLVLNADGMFIQIGHIPDTSYLKGKIDLHPVGFIDADENLRTKIEGVFVAGDVRVKEMRQIVTACSDGAIAANNAFKYLENN